MNYLAGDWLMEQQAELGRLQGDLRDSLQLFRSGVKALPEFSSRLAAIQAKIEESDQSVAEQTKRVRSEGDLQIGRFEDLLRKAGELANGQLVWNLKQSMEALQADQKDLQEKAKALTSRNVDLDHRLSQVEKGLREALAQQVVLERRMGEQQTRLCEDLERRLVALIAEKQRDTDAAAQELQRRLVSEALRLGQRLTDIEQSTRKDREKLLLADKLLLDGVRALESQDKVLIARINEEGVLRTMLTERFQDLEGNLQGFVSWFRTCGPWRRLFQRGPETLS